MFRAIALALLAAGLAWHRPVLAAPDSATLWGALCLWGALSYFALAGGAHRLSRRVALIVVMVMLAHCEGLNPVIWFELIRTIPERIVNLGHDNLMCKLAAGAAGMAYAAGADLLHEARVRSCLQR